MRTVPLVLETPPGMPGGSFYFATGSYGSTFRWPYAAQLGFVITLHSVGSWHHLCATTLDIATFNLLLHGIQPWPMKPISTNVLLPCISRGFKPSEQISVSELGNYIIPILKGREQRTITAHGFGSTNQIQDPYLIPFSYAKPNHPTNHQTNHPYVSKSSPNKNLRSLTKQIIQKASARGEAHTSRRRGRWLILLSHAPGRQQQGRQSQWPGSLCRSPLKGWRETTKKHTALPGLVFFV